MQVQESQGTIKSKSLLHHDLKIPSILMITSGDLLHLFINPPLLSSAKVSQKRIFHRTLSEFYPPYDLVDSSNDYQQLPFHTLQWRVPISEPATAL